VTVWPVRCNLDFGFIETLKADVAKGSDCTHKLGFRCKEDLGGTGLVRRKQSIKFVY